MLSMNGKQYHAMCKAEILTKLTAGETNYMSLLPINNNKEY